MKTSIQATALLGTFLTMGFSFSGCISPRQLSVENRATGEAQQTFSTGEVPTLVARGGGGAMGDVRIKVFSLPYRKLIVMRVIPETADDPENGILLPVEPRLGDEVTKVGDFTNLVPRLPLPGLERGDYVAELWYEGKMESNVNFTVRGGPKTPARSGVAHVGSEILGSGDLSSGGFDIERLDGVVGLTNEQRKQAAKIYAEFQRSMDEFRTSNPGARTWNQIITETRVQIRAILTPEQRIRFDEEVQPSIDNSVALLDEIVGLTDEQRANAVKIYAEQFEAQDDFLASNPEGTTRSQNMTETRAKLRAILTPEQQAKFDEDLRAKRAVAKNSPPPTTQMLTNGGSFVSSGNPQIDADRALNAYIASYLEHSPAIAARVGPIVRVRPAGGSRSAQRGGPERDPDRRGTVSFAIEGSLRAETVNVSWEKPAKGSFKIVRVVGADGSEIPP